MPTTTRVLVKASVLYLCLGALLGVVLLFHRWVPLSPAIVLLKTSHVEFLLVGWLTQLIVGVAWWLFPPLQIGLSPFSPQPERRGQAQRGSEFLFWTTFVCLNGGVWLKALCEPLYRGTGLALWSGLSSLSSLFLLAAAITFVVNLWRRVRVLGHKAA
ncbi:MAG: hypothetical protein ACUVWZ_00010 [Anaerolineae bacterium]